MRLKTWSTLALICFFSSLSTRDEHRRWATPQRCAALGAVRSPTAQDQGPWTHPTDRAHDDDQDDNRPACPVDSRLAGTVAGRLHCSWAVADSSRAWSSSRPSAAPPVPHVAWRRQEDVQHHQRAERLERMGHEVVEQVIQRAHCPSSLCPHSCHMLLLMARNVAGGCHTSATTEWPTSVAGCPRC